MEVVHMIEYLIELKMADKNFPITDQMMKLIADCANTASLTTVSQKNNRTFSVEKRVDDYTIIVKIISKSTITPTRTMSTLTRAVTHNEELYNIVKNRIINGLIFHTTVLNMHESQIVHIPDTEIISEIVSIFFKTDYSPKEKILAQETAVKLREIIIEYKNTQLTL